MGSIFKGVKIIFTLIGGIKTIKDLAAGDAPHVITLDEIRSLIRGEHARFFTTITLADIEYIHDDFYNASLPSITSTSNITADDLKAPTGRLYHAYQSLINATKKLGPILKELARVFESYFKDLHPDELVSGAVALTRAYGLLLHIHATFAELHRIEIGASTLDHPDLKYDTLSALHYFEDASRILHSSKDFMSRITLWVLQNRLDRIGSLKPFWGSTDYWYFVDDYSSLPSTPSNLQLSPPGDHDIVCSPDLHESERQRGDWVGVVNNRVFQVIEQFDVSGPMDDAQKLLKERAIKQGVPPDSEELPQARVTIESPDEKVMEIMKRVMRDRRIGDGDDAQAPEPHLSMDAELATVSSADAPNGN